MFLFFGQAPCHLEDDPEDEQISSGRGGGGVIRDTPLSSKLFKEQAPLNQYVSVWTTGIMEASGYNNASP